MATSSSVRSIDLSSDWHYSVVAAIDFGTSSSGYAFGFRKKYSDDIELDKVQLNKWQAGSASSSTDKAPTTVLLKPDISFDSFGYKAEDKYAKLCDTKRHQGWRYFEKFKMMLYEKKLSRETELKDAEGNVMPAIDIFSTAIGHLKSCLLKDIRNQSPDVKDDDILYVLTVPAIWSDAAKQFMREAATKPDGCIKNHQLALVLEPEAGSVFCRHRRFRVARNAGEETVERGHKYTILDLGGGTADIASHEVIESGKLHEINYARGDNLGGQQFNEKFLQFLGELFGEEIFREWRLSKHGDFLRLQRAVEGIKWGIADDDDDDDILFEVPYSLNKTIHSLEDRLSRSRFNTDVELVNEVQLLLKPKFVRGMFETILSGVENHMKEICRDSENIDTIFMVGGLAKSAYVQQYIRKKFPRHQVIIPEDPGVAVLKGAVMLGNKPQMIAGRIARFSYGIRVAPFFVKGKHDERYKFTRDGEVLCDNVFSKMIEKGDVLKYGDTFNTTTYLRAKLNEIKQTVFSTKLYQSTSTDPSYITDPGCTQLGEIKERPPEGGWPDITKSKVEIIVGEAEFKFHVSDDLGREYKTTVDFLSQK